MRITILSLSFNTVSGGGSHHTLRYLLQNLKESGHAVILITLYSENNKFRSPNDRENINHIEKNISGTFLSQQKQISLLLKDLEAMHQSDLFIAYGPAFIWAGGMYKKSGGMIPTVAYINNYTAGMGLIHKEHETLSDKIFKLKTYIWEKIIGKQLVKNLDALVFDSPITQKLYENFGYTAKQNKVSPEFISVKSEITKESSEDFGNFQSTQSINILYVGRLTHDKGVDLIVEALKNPALINVTAKIVGSGPQQQDLKNLIQKYNLKNIHLYEWVDERELGKFYREADVFVHPCRWPEPFGRTIVEAMSYGLPIITTEGSGSAWVAGDAGLIMKKPEQKELTHILEKIISKKINLENYEMQAYARAAYFAPEKHFQVLESFLKSLI